MYSSTFYAGINHRSESAARRILPLLRRIAPFRTCVDVGCGEGIWARVAEELGSSRILGVDGKWVDRQRLSISQEQFCEIDLANSFTLDERFDVALSLEVAEHLPPSSADTFIASLCSLAPIVLFSAAVPLQGGTLHLNEQWPAYWYERFLKNDFVCIDAIRPNIWNDDNVAYYYRQNSLLFVQADCLPAIIESVTKAQLRYLLGEPLALVHPTKFLGTASLRDINPSVFMRSFPLIGAKFLKSKCAVLWGH